MIYYVLVGLIITLVFSIICRHMDDPVTKEYIWLYPACIILWPVVLGIAFVLLIKIYELTEKNKYCILLYDSFNNIGDLLVKDK